MVINALTYKHQQPTDSNIIIRGSLLQFAGFLFYFIYKLINFVLFDYVVLLYLIL